QDDRSKQRDQSMVDNLHFVKELGYQSKEAMEAGDLVRFAELMNVHWEHKKKRSGSMSNDRINQWYELAKANGALGGKLIGAGGGGFLMFYAEEKVCLRRAVAGGGLRGGGFRFGFEGTRGVIHWGEGEVCSDHRGSGPVRKDQGRWPPVGSLGLEQRRSLLCACT